MSHKRVLTALFVAASAAFTAAFSAQAIAAPIVKIDGSSTVFPITEAVAEDFQISKRGAVMVTVGISGTGGGFKKFCRGEIDIANASRPIKKSEMKDCAKAGIKFHEIPVAFDALTVVINPSNTWVKSLTVAQLKTIWEPQAQGKIMTWKQVNPAWPDQPLSLYGPGADSGTFDYFSEAVTGKSKSSRGDFTASEDDNVLVQGISRDKGALGYFGFAYYLENQKKLNAVPIVPAPGKPGVLPSPKNVEDGSYTPFSRPIFIYVSEVSAKKPEVREIVEYYIANAPTLVTEVKYIPLPAKAYATALKNFNSNKLGTVFGGEAEIGLSIDEVLSREAKH